MKKDLYILLNEIKRLVNLQTSNKLRYYYNNSVYNSKYLFFDNLVKSEVIKKSVYRELLKNYLYKAEKKMPGGSFLFCKFILENFNNKSIYIEEDKKNFENILEMLTQSVPDVNRAKLIENIFKFSGPDCSIVCETTENDKIEVIKNNKACFNIKLHKEFENIYFTNQNSSTKTFKTIVMDSYIERESEIMTLIDEAHKEKLPVLLICRGISDNFVRNIKSIILKNKIHVYPYIANFNDKDPFFMSDIAKMLGIEVFSVESGDVFTKNLVSKSINKKLKINKSSIEFFESCESLKTELNRIMSETTDTDLKQYLLERKKRVATNKTIIYIPKKDIRVINDIKSFVFLYNQIIMSDILKHDNIIYPSNRLNVIKTMSEKFFKQINEISCIVALKG